MKSKIYIGSVHNKKDRDYAALVVSQGGVIGVFNRGVNALWIKGEDQNSVSQLQALKGESGLGKPVALTIGFDKLLKMLDQEFVTPQVREFIAQNRDFKQILGSLCFLRIPIMQNLVSQLPISSISQDENNRPWIQTWDPHGHKPVEMLLKKMRELGVKYPAISSMNNFGEPELIDQQEAIEFCRVKGIKVYLHDAKTHQDLVGSYTILTLDQSGVSAARNGNIPISIIQRILPASLSIDTKNSKKPVHPQMEFPSTLADGLNPVGIRMAVLIYISGQDPQQINHKLRSVKKYQA